MRSREACRCLCLAALSQQVEKESVLGCGTCRVLSGQRRPELTREEGLRLAADGIWQYPEFVQAMDVFCDLVDRFASPHFGASYDPSGTLLAGEDQLELPGAAEPYLRRRISRLRPPWKASGIPVRPSRSPSGLSAGGCSRGRSGTLVRPGTPWSAGRLPAARKSAPPSRCRRAPWGRDSPARTIPWGARRRR